MIITFNDLCFETQQDILLTLKGGEIEKLKEEGMQSLDISYVSYAKWFAQCEQTVPADDRWMIAIVSLYGFTVPDPDQWDRTAYLFVIEEFAEEQAVKRINKFQAIGIAL